MKKIDSKAKFIKEYMNDHNGGTPRWLRGIFMDEGEKIEAILDCMDEIEERNSQIKQSILKAIMEAKPKIEHDDWEHDCDGCSILGERRGIKRFESVIKEVLK